MSKGFAHARRCDRSDRYLAQTEREHPEVLDKIERLSRRKRREPLPLRRMPILITAAVLLAVAGLIV